ncbi:hypothetical protein [Brevibacillus laterosporus]|uniref:hypothetical protein n=1 Tax=Brevibacillus laterosporus TaxID=1465 RepID=UPI00265CF1B5|nr:hypothetical protein [Brevibacillus laterosporus]
MGESRHSPTFLSVNGIILQGLLTNKREIVVVIDPKVKSLKFNTSRAILKINRKWVRKVVMINGTTTREIYERSDE